MLNLVLGVLVLGATSTSLRAQTAADYDYENLTFRGIGLDWGYIWPSKVVATPTYSLRLDLGFLGPAVRISPSITYWSSTIRTRELARLAEQLNRLPSLQDRNIAIQPSELGRISWSDLSASVDAHLVWTTPFDVFTYVGAGVGLHALNGKGSAVEGTFVEDLLDSTSGAVAFMAGVESQLFARLRIYGEGRFTLVSDLKYPGFRVGAAFMLPPRTAPAGGGTQGGR
ncbi:MAG: hypothetical protein WEE89_22830 [Gemmatimonadota bacterium]